MVKNVTFAIGLLILFIGAYFKVAPDWDYGVSIVMAGFTYVTAPYVYKAIASPWDFKRFLTASFLVWYTVDGSYATYWFFVDRSVLLMMRDVQWPVSLAMYFMCVIIWSLDKPKTLTDSTEPGPHLLK